MNKKLLILKKKKTSLNSMTLCLPNIFITNLNTAGSVDKIFLSLHYHLKYSSIALAKTANWRYVPPMVVSMGYWFLDRNPLACPPVVRSGMFQTLVKRATGASEYGQTGPRNTSGQNCGAMECIFPYLRAEII